MRVPVILLNYNSSADCRDCVADLKRQEGVELDIVIVDNCSPREGEHNTIRQLCTDEGCTFIQAKENRGYNAGNNIGLRYAAEKGYKYALIANPDMRFPQTDYVAQLVKVMEEKPEVAVCGSDIVSPEGIKQSPKRYTTYYEELMWPFYGFFKLFIKQELVLNIGSQYCQIVMGSCIFVRLSFIKKIGFFDENVFLYCEEPILGKQVERAGMKMYYYNGTHAIHAHIPSKKGSFVKRHDIYWKSRWYYLSHYAGYSKFQLAMMSCSRCIQYLFKRIQFALCGIK